MRFSRGLRRLPLVAVGGTDCRGQGWELGDKEEAAALVQQEMMGDGPQGEAVAMVRMVGF